MKKINKIFVTGKSEKSNRYLKWIFVFLFAVLIALSAALIKFYFDVNKSTEKKEPDHGIITDFNSSANGYRTFTSEYGGVGVVNDDGRVIVEPEWNSIHFLKADRFIVSQMFNGIEKMGIIDIDDNIITPFIFQSFDPVGQGLVKGYVSEEDGFIIFDVSGNLLSGYKWDSVSLRDDKIILTKDKDTFSAVVSNGHIEIITADMIREADGHLIYFKTEDKKLLSLVNEKKLSEIMNISSIYLDSLIKNDKKTIAGLTEKQYYSALAENNIFDNCSLNNFTTCSISVKENSDSFSYVFSAVADYDYKVGDTEIKNIISEISLNIINDEKSGKLILKSINKNEL